MPTEIQFSVSSFRTLAYLAQPFAGGSSHYTLPLVTFDSYHKQASCPVTHLGVGRWHTLTESPGAPPESQVSGVWQPQGSSCSSYLGKRRGSAECQVAPQAGLTRKSTSCCCPTLDRQPDDLTVAPGQCPEGSCGQCRTCRWDRQRKGLLTLTSSNSF